MRWTNKTLDLKEKKSKKTILYSLIVFSISIVIFNATSNDLWVALSGFFMIISASVIVLFFLIYLILKIVESSKNVKSENKTPQKKVVRKKTSSKKKAAKKKTTTKKVASKKKPASKKKTTKKKTAKRATKKRPTSKKR